MFINSSQITKKFQMFLTTVLPIICVVLFSISNCNAEDDAEISKFDFNGSSQLKIELEHHQKRARVLFTDWHCPTGITPSEQTRRTLAVLDAYARNFFSLEPSQKNALKQLNRSIADIKFVNGSTRGLLEAKDYASTQAALSKFVARVISQATLRIKNVTNSKSFKEPIIISASNGVTSSFAINNCYKSSTLQKIAQLEITAAERIQAQISALETLQALADNNKGNEL